MQPYLTNISVREAIAAYACIQAVAPKRVPIFEATGLRLAEDVIVRRAIPAVAVAARDGWAIAAAATAGATRRKPARIEGQPVLLDVGAPLPAGADAVLPQLSAVSRLRGLAAIRPVAPGEGAAPAAAFAGPGLVLAPAGARITFAMAMACAQCEVMDVAVRRPVVDIIFNAAGYTRTRDLWTGVVSAAIRASSAQIGGVQFTAGDPALLAETLAASSADVITVVGGTGAGPGDTTMQAIAAAGEVVFHGVRLSPGATAGFGMVGGRPVFAAPGGVADLIAANIILSWHFARRAFGRPAVEPHLLRGRLTNAIPASPGGSRLVFAHHADGLVTPFVDGPVTPAVLAAANASIFVPEGARHRRRGEQVEVLRMGVNM